MKLVNNLVFKGDCRDAFEHYAAVLGGEIKAMFSFGDSPQEMPFKDQYRDMIMHAWLQIGDQALMGCDAPPVYQQPMGEFSVALHTHDVAESKRYFDALADGGTVSMPFLESFWSPGFGMLTDCFGTPWLINTMVQERQSETNS